MKIRQYSQAQKNSVLSLSRRGLSAHYLSKQLNIPRTNIRRWIKEAEREKGLIHTEVKPSMWKEPLMMAPKLFRAHDEPSVKMSPELFLASLEDDAQNILLFVEMFRRQKVRIHDLKAERESLLSASRAHQKQIELWQKFAGKMNEQIEVLVRRS